MSKDDKDIVKELMMTSMGQISHAMYRADKKLAEMLEGGRISKDDRFALWEQIEFVQRWVEIEVNGRYGEGTHDKLALKFGVNERQKRITKTAKIGNQVRGHLVHARRDLAEATSGEVNAEEVSRLAKVVEDRQEGLDHWKASIPEDERAEVLAIYEKGVEGE